jgi:hypothetical protein
MNSPPSNANPASDAARIRWLSGLVSLSIGGVMAWLIVLSRQPAGSIPETPSVSTAPASKSAALPIATADQNWDERWRQWLVRLSATGQEVELAAEFEALILENPARALASARRETDAARRTSLIQMILLLWAESDPAAAAAQARALPDEERALGVAAVLAGVSNQTEVAVRLATEFCRDDPALASEHGYALIAALGRTGEFRAAIRFAVGAEAAVEGEDQNKWLKAAFAQWAAQNPAAAMAAIQELPGGGPRFEALDAIATNRVLTDPAGLAAALRNLPVGPDRSLVLGQTLRAWVNSDAKTAADWLNQLEPSLELDAGAAAVATSAQSHTLNQRPEVALSWAESIVSAELRSRTLVAVVQKWAMHDLLAAQHYVQTSTDLLPADRVTLLNMPNTPAP